jgi:addiction module HigA family antidote
MSAMFNPPHPGELFDDYLGDVSLAEAARRLGVTRATLSRIRNGHASVTADMAVRLGELLGTSAELWLGMQSAHDLWVERQRNRPLVAALAMNGVSHRSTLSPTQLGESIDRERNDGE